MAAKSPDGRRGGRTARSEDRRAEIVEAALAVLAERGYRGTTLGAVADRVGLTQQGLLHYFPTKEALLTAVLDASGQWDLTAAALHGTGWPLEMLASLVEYHATRPALVRTYTVLAADSVTARHPARAFFRRRYRRAREGGANALREEYGQRLAGGLTPERAAPLLTAVLDGLQLQWLLDPDSVDMAAAFRDFLRLLSPEAREAPDAASAPRAPDEDA
ncbi:TetR/AcrR family transcriptional regulator [Streptomyces sp. PTM05]|uniref:TetR/AcrR family transcriptional regulator n=1 Tax=Streptantibioticus parmotrematis TaxID=2873249 RepID=A0ABS7R1J9_9ACTN|nr:TetR/AcrR family transcriptional regulator [Streptantibioticus parmotrematis]MBY8887909.1 TetR/AcrR family transcriptional regulator [Streptantibioticus parmotrematis]